MATTPTNKPIPSEDPRDLKFNAGKIDEVVSGDNHYYTDRFGVRRFTIAGFQYTAEEAIRNYGYITMDSFEDGATLTLLNQVLRHEATGEYYRWDGSFPKIVPAGSTPETAGGIGLGAWVGVGANALRGEFGVIAKQFESVADAVADKTLKAGQLVTTISYHAGWAATVRGRPSGGNDYVVVSGTGASDGGSFINTDNGMRLKGLFTNGISIDNFGAEATDSTNSIQSAINYASSIGGALIKASSDIVYTISSEVSILENNVVLDFCGATVISLVPAGAWTISLGDGNAVKQRMGCINANIDGKNAGGNGVRIRKNVRRDIRYDNLVVTGFPGTGLKFDELNWCTPAMSGVRLEKNGVNLWIDDNGNAVTLDGLVTLNAVQYNIVIRGCFSVTLLGGICQGAGISGLYVDIGSVGTLQPTESIKIIGTYFEDNKVHHIHCKNGQGAEISAFINSSSSTGAAIKFENWEGAHVHECTVINNESVDFVETDSTSSQIVVGKNYATTATNLSVNTLGGYMQAVEQNENGVVASKASLPEPTPLNRNTIRGVIPVSGTDIGRGYLYVATQDTVASRVWKQIQFAPNKQPAGVQASPYTPNLTSTQIFDITLPAGEFVISAPTGPYKDGDEFKILMRASPSGSTITFNSIYKTSISPTAPANAHGSVTFTYSAGRSVWMQTGGLEWKL